VVLSDIEERRCTYHPNVQTRLRCSKCETPICPRCAVDTPVGFRCPNCAAVRGLPSYPTSAGGLAKAVVAGLVVALLVGGLWGIFPAWRFYLALLLGFGVAEAIARMVHDKRGQDLQLAGLVLVGLGLVVSRVVMIDYHSNFGVGTVLNNATNPLFASAFQLKLIPDALFAALALAIPWVRFR
jgi:hypothetical protein